MKKIGYWIMVKSIGLYINVLSYVRPQLARNLAYRLFTSPRDGKLDPRELPPVLKASLRKTLRLQETAIETYLWKGKGDKILLVHGWESNASRWEPMLKHLQSYGAEVLALDAPSHGLSVGEFNLLQYARAVDHVVRDFDPDYIVGHSLGGMTIAYYLHHYRPSNLRKAVLLGAPSDFEILVGNYAQLLSLNSRSKALFESYFTQNLQVDISGFSARYFGETIDLEAFVAHDEHDEVVKFEESLKIVSKWKKAQRHATRNLGHSMHDDALYLQISEFLFGKKQLI